MVFSFDVSSTQLRRSSISKCLLEILQYFSSSVQVFQEISYLVSSHGNGQCCSAKYLFNKFLSTKLSMKLSTPLISLRYFIVFLINLQTLWLYKPGKLYSSMLPMYFDGKGFAFRIIIVFDNCAPTDSPASRKAY